MGANSFKCLAIATEPYSIYRQDILNTIFFLFLFVFPLCMGCAAWVQTWIYFSQNRKLLKSVGINYISNSRTFFRLNIQVTFNHSVYMYMYWQALSNEKSRNRKELIAVLYSSRSAGFELFIHWSTLFVIRIEVQ